MNAPATATGTLRAHLQTLAEGMLAGTLRRPGWTLLLTVVGQRVPDELRTRLFDPYLAADGRQLRFALRIYESMPDLHRDRLLQTLRHELRRRFDLKPEQVRLTGLTALYNNVLQSRFRSQALSFGFVLLALLGMFQLLFQSLAIKVIALAPNLLVALMMLGLLRWPPRADDPGTPIA